MEETCCGDNPPALLEHWELHNILDLLPEGFQKEVVRLLHESHPNTMTTLRSNEIAEVLIEGNIIHDLLHRAWDSFNGAGDENDTSMKDQVWSKLPDFESTRILVDSRIL